MKAIKLSKKDLKDTTVLLKKANAVVGDQAYPGAVYISKEDAALLKANLRAAIKKEFPYLKKGKVDYTLGLEWLNLGPNESLQNVIRPGYILVDTTAIPNIKAKEYEPFPVK